MVSANMLLLGSGSTRRRGCPQALREMSVSRLTEARVFGEARCRQTSRASPALAGHDPPSEAGFVFLGSRDRALRSARLGGARADAACRDDLLTPSSKQLCFAVDGELPSAANEAPIPAPLRAQMLAREQA